MTFTIPSIVTVQHLFASQRRVELVCGFYGPTHPKCKEILAKDEELYTKFLNQISSTQQKSEQKVDDDK